MKVLNANLSPLNTAGQAGRNQGLPASSRTVGDDIHLSELVRSLRSMAPDSPERQERLERIARAYADGTYQADAEATAGSIIDDARRYS